MPPQIDQIKSVDENEDIQPSAPVYQNENQFNVRKYLLILLSIQWFLFALTLGFGVYSITVGNAADLSDGLKSLLPLIVLVLYYTFGLLVTYKQHRTGLLIFVFIGVLLFISTCILIGYIFLAVVALGVGFGNINQSYGLIVLIAILFTVVVIIAIVTLKFSFDLAKSIKRIDYSTV